VGGKDFGRMTLRVANMSRSVRFYRDVFGMELVYGGEDAYFSWLRAEDTECPILNLEQGRPVSRWGRMIFYVADVDAFWTYLKERGFDPERPQDASWGERYFSFAASTEKSCYDGAGNFWNAVSPMPMRRVVCDARTCAGEKIFSSVC